MANLKITPQWHPKINQIEESDFVQGGTPNAATGQGTANIATSQLADNIFWLESQLEGKAEQAEVDAAKPMHDWTVDVGGVGTNFYPVVFATDRKNFNYIEISRQYHEVPRSGIMGLFSKWAVIGGVTGNGPKVIPLLYSYTYRTPVARAGRISDTNLAAFWLRGGMRYHISSSPRGGLLPQDPYWSPTPLYERTLIFDLGREEANIYVDILTSVDTSMVANGHGLDGAFSGFAPNM